jgi:hypothetical protein
MGYSSLGSCCPCPWHPAFQRACAVFTITRNRSVSWHEADHDSSPWCDWCQIKFSGSRKVDLGTVEKAICDFLMPVSSSVRHDIIDRFAATNESVFRGVWLALNFQATGRVRGAILHFVGKIVCDFLIMISNVRLIIGTRFRRFNSRKCSAETRLLPINVFHPILWVKAACDRGVLVQAASWETELSEYVNIISVAEQYSIVLTHAVTHGRTDGRTLLWHNADFNTLPAYCSTWASQRRWDGDSNQDWGVWVTWTSAADVAYIWH